MQEKAANAMTLKSDSVRWVMGPAGTVVTFPSDMGLPSIFEPKPCRCKIYFSAKIYFIVYIHCVSIKGKEEDQRKLSYRRFIHDLLKEM